MSIKFCIIIPCYNSEKWIEQCINSALDQDYDNKQVIFVDNESTDNSLNIARNIQKERQELIISTAPNVYKYSYQEPVEKALEITDADYFTIFGSDDYAETNYISNICEILEKSNLSINFLQSPLRGFRANTNELTGEIKHKYKSITEFKSLLLQKCPVTTPSMVFKKEMYDKGILKWNSEKCLGAMDYDAYFRIADNNEFIYPFPKWLGYIYRWHQDQATWGMHKEQTNYDKSIQDYWRKKWNL